MIPFLVMLIAFGVLHLPGLRQWPGGRRPADKAAGAMGLALLLPAWLHFASPELFLPMIADGWPAPDRLVFLSGVSELVVAVLLLVPRTRRIGGWAAVLLFLALWPANIHAALSGTTGPSFAHAPLYLWLRVPFQLLYVAWAAWVALRHVPGLDLRRRMMARLYDRVMADYETAMGPRRRALLGGVGGRVLELGPGTGVNLGCFAPGTRWIGIEPNPHMHPALEARASGHGIDAECRVVGAEGMDVPDASVDAVVSTLVLCSVPDAEATLAEVQRVLKPGGHFYFLEHVAAPKGTPLRRRQRLLRPLWQFCADGCSPDRELDRLIRDAGFETIEMDAFEMPREAAPAFVSLHVVGVGSKSTGSGRGPTPPPSPAQPRAHG